MLHPRVDSRADEQQDAERHERQDSVRDVEGGEVDEEDLASCEPEQPKTEQADRRPAREEARREPGGAEDRPQCAEADLGFLLELLERPRSDLDLEVVDDAPTVSR
jgi:hypothetical protein